MGSLTRAALASLRDHAGTQSASVEVVSELLAIARACGQSPQLVQTLGNASFPPAERQKLAGSLFHGASSATKKLVDEAVSHSWSDPQDLLEGLEELAFRLAATADKKADVVGELLAVDKVVRAEADVQLALSSKRADHQTKMTMVDTLFGQRVSPVTREIVRHLVAQPRGRRLTEALPSAARVLCDQRGEGLAEIRVASPLSQAQHKDIQALLTARFGRPHYLDEVVDPEIVGGIRIRVGDHVIDNTVATQLAEMRRRLAG